MGHVIVWRSWFESLGNSVGKIASKNFHVIKLLSPPKILYIPFVIQSVYTDNIILSVYSNKITEGFTSVGKYHRKLLTEKFHR